MGEQTVPKSRVAFQAYEAEEKKAQERKKILLYIIEDYLKEEGFWDTARALTAEAKLNNSYVVCDNIDLATILKEYENYYQIKIGKPPKLCRRRDPGEPSKPVPTNPKLIRKPTKPYVTTTNAPAPAPPPFGFDMTVTAFSPGETGVQAVPATDGIESCLRPPGSPPISVSRPLSGFYGASIELREMVELISKDIIQRPTMRLKDVIGLEEAKRALTESILLPRKHPYLFRGILAPNVGILLHGPPGTGKTLLATAIAGESTGVVLRLHACSLVSKWRGDSEKLVRVLFDLAQYLAPSIIFLDEVDALVNMRGNRSEHEATRRMQAELLVQLDLLTATSENAWRDPTNGSGDPRPNSFVTVIAATNVPWELDAAFLRRLGKRILVDLPDLRSREEIFRLLLPPKQEISSGFYFSTDLDYVLLAQATEGFSGSDLKLICKEAATGTTRSFLNSLAEGKRAPQTLDKVTTDNLLGILDRVRPSSSYDVERFHKWQLSYGSV